jgi:hypothetical protein
LKDGNKDIRCCPRHVKRIAAGTHRLTGQSARPQHSPSPVYFAGICMQSP